MSRIGKKLITIPSGVTIEKKGSTVVVKGGKGELSFPLTKGIDIEINGDKLTVLCTSDEELARMMYGTTRAIIDNMVTGVSKGFKKTLEIQGVGYRANMKGKDLGLSLGFSHEVIYKPMDGVTVAIDEKLKNIIHVTGIDKQKVGEVAAQIRGLKKPEPYKGKGIRYEGEKILRKAGKSASK